MIFQNATTSPYKTVVNADTANVEGSILHLVNARVTKFKPTGEVDGDAVQKTLDIGCRSAKRSISS
jgi:hypothetical protein